MWSYGCRLHLPEFGIKAQLVRLSRGSSFPLKWRWRPSVLIIYIGKKVRSWAAIVFLPNIPLLTGMTFQFIMSYNLQALQSNAQCLNCLSTVYKYMQTDTKFYESTCSASLWEILQLNTELNTKDFKASHEAHIITTFRKANNSETLSVCWLPTRTSSEGR